MIPEIPLRAATEDDAELLAELGSRTFIETFARYNTHENMAIYLREAFSLERLKLELRDPKRTTVIAEVDGDAVGYSQLRAADPDRSVTGERPIELLRLYVESRAHGKGVGPRLMEHLLEVSRTRGFRTMWLGVWEKNFRAKSFYIKYGFRPVGEHTFMLGTDAQRDLILARELGDELD